MNNYFIGIDFAKEKFDAVLLLRGKLNETVCHQTFENSINGYRAFIRWAKGNGAKSKDETLICGENTGAYSKLISDTLAKDGYAMWLENPLQIKHSLGIRRGKNDKQDAHDIAEFAARNEDKVKLHKAPTKEMEALCFYYSEHKSMVQEKSNLQRIIKSQSFMVASNPYLKAELKRNLRLLESIKERCKEIVKCMEELIAAVPELLHTYNTLTSMKGIGVINAMALIIVTDNFTRFDYDARRLCSYYGVAPFAFTSGSSINGKPHVSRFADSYLKALISEAVLCAIRYCPAIRDYAMRLRQRGKHPSIILNNCKNKMLHILMAMVKNGTEYGKNVTHDTLS